MAALAGLDQLIERADLARQRGGELLHVSACREPNSDAIRSYSAALISICWPRPSFDSWDQPELSTIHNTIAPIEKAALLNAAGNGAGAVACA
jgi:hypothetical protein